MRVIGFICLAPWLAGCLATPPEAVAPTPVAVPVLAYPAPDRSAAPSAAKRRPPKPASKSTAPKSRAPQIAAVIAPPPPKPARLMGLGATEVSKLLGVPARVRRERRGRTLQNWTGGGGLRLFFFPAPRVLKKNILILCGHYKGIDQRVRDYLITKEITIGDYVLSGGELPAAVLCDAIIRLIPGVLNNETSALTDSFQDDLLAPPVYTRPSIFNGWEVPKILTSGDFKAIEKWREKKAIENTQNKRPLLGDQQKEKN